MGILPEHIRLAVIAMPSGEIWLVDTDGQVRHVITELRPITGFQVPSRDANPHPAETGTALDGRPYFVPLGCDPAHYRPSPKQDEPPKLGCDFASYPDRSLKQDVPPKPADAPTPPAEYCYCLTQCSGDTAVCRHCLRKVRDASQMASTMPTADELNEKLRHEINEKLRQDQCQVSGNAGVGPLPKVLDTAMLDSLIGIYDATYWARSFLAVVRWKPELATDYDTMLTWFGHALMTGYDKGRKSERS